ncbi:MAG: Hsp20/alpha crystallin family protein [Acidobacteria bacterium]|nr:Hsp20/alpha crystallin family protein [Acidobacteriota bacterium]
MAETRKNRNKGRQSGTGSTSRPGGVELGLGGILKGLGDLVEKLHDLAETGQELSRSGELRGEGGQLKGIYGFTVKVGLGEEGSRIEPFGNIRRDATSGRTVVQEVREPVVDVFEEEKHVMVVAEMPGVSPQDLRLDLEGDVLTISAERGDKKYRKELLLPASFTREQMQVSSNNGVVEIRLVR